MNTDFDDIMNGNFGIDSESEAAVDALLGAAAADDDDNNDDDDDDDEDEDADDDDEKPDVGLVESSEGFRAPPPPPPRLMRARWRTHARVACTNSTSPIQKLQ